MHSLSGRAAARAISMATTMILNACYTSSLRPDAAQAINAELQNQDQGVDAGSKFPPDQVARLWRDKPEYVALVYAPPLAKRMRVISAFPPAYPYMLHFHVEGVVTVSFVVGITGQVEDARVIQSSDSRFNAAAIEAIMKFKWIPAEDSSGAPTPEMGNVPFRFKPTGKPQNASTSP